MRLKVRELVESRGLTWQRFAEETGLSKQTVHALMSGNMTRIDLRTLDVLCRYFRVGAGDIIEHD
jgi:DNA-binding Xre family transcriptional regulator